MRSAVLLAAVMWSVALTAAGATPDDFKQAAQNKGCASIPYEDLRGKCKDKQPEVERYCRQNSFSCDDLDPTALRRNIEGLTNKNRELKEKMDDIEKMRRELKEQQSSSSSDESKKREIENKLDSLGHTEDSAKSEIYENNKKIDDWKVKHDNERSQINERIYNGKYCVAARDDMRKIFDEVMSKADHETDPAIVPDARELLKYWADEQKKHKEAQDNAQTAIEKCQKML